MSESTVEVWKHDDVAWRVELRWADVDGYAECVGLQIAPADPDRKHGLRATTIRALPFGTLVREARAARYEAEEEPQLRRPRRLDDDHYAEVARIYSNAVARGAAPRKAVAMSMQTSEPTASRWISEARTRGLLPPTRPGKARGLTFAPDADR